MNALGSSRHGSVVTNPTGIRGDMGLTPGLAQWVKDLALLWLWYRPAAAAPIQPLAWEPPCAAGAAQEIATTTTTTKRQKTKDKRQKKKKEPNYRSSCCGAVETNLTRNHEVGGSIPGLSQWVQDPALL